MPEPPSREKSVVVHQAGTATEAVVIRSLLASVGITSPDPVSSEPFPMREPPEGFRDTDIIVLESKAEEARRVIADYLSSADSVQVEEVPDSGDAPNPDDASS